LTIGSRFLPWRSGFSLLAALDIGLSGVSTFVEETVPTAPWTLFVGAGWAIDTHTRPPVVATRTIEKIVEIGQSRARIKGRVLEKDKPTGVVNAVVAYDAHPEITSMATGPDGRFTTEELPEGVYKFNVRVEGYRDGFCETTMPKGTQDVTLDCVVDALPRVGTVSGKVRDAETQDAVPNASIRLSAGVAGSDLALTSDSTGGFRFENVPPGTVTLSVDADNYLAGVQTGDVKVRQDNAIDVPLRHRPKTALVAIGKTEITIKQAVQFATDSATILPESFPLLTEVADVFIKNPRIKRVEVQGHTDNTGTPDRNKTLSEQRASAVRTWLLNHGVLPDRLVAKGYGQEKPIAPNVTASTKAKNRRVQFVILEQDPATDAKTPPAKTDATKSVPNFGF
jgi:OmpA-OmpF porin, OOP family